MWTSPPAEDVFVGQLRDSGLYFIQLRMAAKLTFLSFDAHEPQFDFVTTMFKNTVICNIRPNNKH